MLKAVCLENEVKIFLKNTVSDVKNKEYSKYLNKNRLILIIGILLIIVMFFVSVNAGAAKINFKDVILGILGQADNKTNMILKNMRLPRVISGVVVGFGLGIAGCITQNVLRNPLASPSTLGITNAAAFGANFSIIFLNSAKVLTSEKGNVQVASPYSIIFWALFFSLSTAALIVFMAKRFDFSPASIILSGVAISSLFAAATMIVQYFAQDSMQVASVVFWTFGDLGRASWQGVYILSVIVVISFIYFYLNKWEYNAMDAGDDVAKSLGVNTNRVRTLGMFFSSLITAVSISFLGIIGFVGLIAPQIMFRVIGNNKKFLIPAAGVMGSLILLVSDTFARTILNPRILPVGAVTSFLGAPLFMYILIKTKRRGI